MIVEVLLNCPLHGKCRLMWWAYFFSTLWEIGWRGMVDISKGREILVGCFDGSSWVSAHRAFCKYQLWFFHLNC